MENDTKIISPYLERVNIYSFGTDGQSTGKGKYRLRSSSPGL